MNLSSPTHWVWATKTKPYHENSPQITSEILDGPSSTHPPSFSCLWATKKYTRSNETKELIQRRPIKKKKKKKKRRQKLLKKKKVGPNSTQPPNLSLMQPSTSEEIK